MKRPLNFNLKTVFFFAALLLAAAAPALAEEKRNSWIDIPVIETIEYFTSVCVKALQWARKYAALFGLVGIVWSAFKVMTARLQVKQMFWDTLWKYVLFTVLVTAWPNIVFGFLGVATNIGESIGKGKPAVETSITSLRQKVLLERGAAATEIKKIDEQIRQKTGVSLVGTNTGFGDIQKDTKKYLRMITYGVADNKAKKNDGKGNMVPIFDSEKDRLAAQQIINKCISDDMQTGGNVFSAMTMKALDSVCTVKNIGSDDGQPGEDLTDTYVQTKLYLTDENGRDTFYISPAAMMRLSILCGMVIWDKWRMAADAADAEIDASGDWWITKQGKHLVHTLDTIPELIEVMFCALVLIASIAFAMIQYVMTMVEFTIVTSIAACFLPLMLFDGTKDIPKKFIPVMTSFMMKIIVMLVCMYFTMYLLIEHTCNAIGDDWGVNLWMVGEVFFISILCYVLTQNAPKIAQTILTGQPQLSMGEAMAGAGTALATPIVAKQVAAAPFRAAAKAGGAATSVRGAIAKSNAASKAAKESLNPNATGLQKFAAGALGRGAVAAQGLKDWARAKAEKARRSGGTGIGVLDKAMSMASLGGGAGGSGGGAGGGDGAYGRIGTGSYTGSYGKTLNNQSNSNFNTATKFDPLTGHQRAMTAKEFMDEKRSQGSNIGEKVGRWMSEAQDKKGGGGGSDDSSLSDNLTGKTRDS